MTHAYTSTEHVYEIHFFRLAKIFNDN